MKTILLAAIAAAFTSNIGVAFAQENCASIRNPEAMLSCVMKQRNQNLNTTKKSIYIPEGSINDWYKLAEISGGKATFYYSPQSAKFKEVTDPQSPTGLSRVIIVNTLQNFQSPIEDGDGFISSNLITVLFHCERNAMKEMRYEMHTEPMGKGKVLSVRDEPITKKWEGLSEGDDVIINNTRRLCPPIETDQGNAGQRNIPQQGSLPNETDGFELVCENRNYQGKRKPVKVDCNSWADFTQKLGMAWRSVREQAQRDRVPRTLEDNCWKPYEQANKYNRDDHFGRAFRQQYPTPSTFSETFFNQCNIALKFIK